MENLNTSMPKFANVPLMTQAIEQGYTPETDIFSTDPAQQFMGSLEPNPIFPLLQGINPEDLLVGAKGGTATGQGIGVDDSMALTTQEENKAKTLARQSTLGMSEQEVVHKAMQDIANLGNTQSFLYDIPEESDQIWGTVLAVALPMLGAVAAGRSSNVNNAKMAQIIAAVVGSGAKTWDYYDNSIQIAKNIPTLESLGHTPESIQQLVKDHDYNAFAQRFASNPYRGKTRNDTKFYRAGDKMLNGQIAPETGTYDLIYRSDAHGFEELDTINFTNPDKDAQFFKAGQQMPNGETASETGYYSEHIAMDNHGNSELQYKLTKPWTDAEALADKRYKQAVDLQNLRNLNAQELQKLKDSEGRLYASTAQMRDEAGSEAVQLYTKAQSALTMAERVANTPESEWAEGLWGSATKAMTNLVGGQDEFDLLKKQYTALINSEVIGSLPPGAASDKDVQLFLSGFPNDSWDKDQVESWLKGRAKTLATGAKMAEFKADYITRNNGLSSVDGVTYLQAWKQRNGQANTEPSSDPLGIR